MRSEVGAAHGTLGGSAGASYSLRAVERTLDILDAISKSADGLTAAAVATATTMPRSSTFRYLAVLEARGYLSRPDGVHYQLGPAFLSFEQPMLGSLAATARPVLERLRNARGETINLGVLVGTRVLYVDVLESHRAVRLSARQGDREFIHSSALGKAISARLGDGDVQRILRVEGMPRLTPHTITDAEELRGILEAVRSNGYATDHSESEDGACCIGVAIDLGAVPFRAALSLSCPAERFREEDLLSIVRDLRDAADEIAVIMRGSRTEPATGLTPAQVPQLDHVENPRHRTAPSRG